MSGAVNFKHKSRTNPAMTNYDKNMRAIQNIEAKLTGKQNMQGAEDMGQLKALTETIKPATSQTSQTTAGLTLMCKELHSLRIVTSKAVVEKLSFFLQERRRFETFRSYC